MEGAAEEVCNLQDDDCDGETDEDTPPVTCGLGICQNTVNGCKDGKPADCKPLDLAKPDTCNGKDDDCDGETDENQGTIECGKGECRRTIPVCVDGTLQQCDPLTGAAPETCNGLDDNCDGQTDEGLGSTQCGTGKCSRQLPACVDGVPSTCNPYEGAQLETCNGLDDDCDGETDDGLGTKTCVDTKGQPYTIPACQSGAEANCPAGGTTGGGTTGSGAGGGGGGGAAPGGGGDGCASGTGAGGSGGAALLLALIVLAAVRARRRGRAAG